MTCHWCGDQHGVDQLCQRAQRGMTRRSFCFLFGAGVAGALLPKTAARRDVWILDDIGRSELGVATRLGFADDALVGMSVIVGNGPGVGQRRIITAYDGATNIAALDRAWATTPDSSAVFVLKP